MVLEQALRWGHRPIEPVDKKEDVIKDFHLPMSRLSHKLGSITPKHVKEWEQRGMALTIFGKRGQHDEELGQDVKVSLDTIVQHTLKWDNPITIAVDGESEFVTLRAGQVNLYKFPEVQPDSDTPGRKLVGGELKVLQRLVAALIAKPYDITTDCHDISGATPVHALLVANTDAALDTVMAMFRAKPMLMYQTHTSTRDGTNLFNGENCLIIAAVNRREKQVCEMIEIARQLEPLDRVKLYTEQPTGVFFDGPPMHRYGGTPLAYMACFGMKKALALLLHGESRPVTSGGAGIDLNSKELACHRTGMLPIHAVTANGLKDMFDYLATLTDEALDASGELPFKLADLSHTQRAVVRLRTLEPGIKVSSGGVFTDLTPLQLTALLGSQRMFRRVIQMQTVTEWTWGPAANYQIYLDEIDSAGDGGNDVMELVGRLDAKKATKEMLLDKFMAGFLYKLYEQKWDKFGWHMHVAQLALFATYLALLLIIGFWGFDGHELPEHVANGELVVDGASVDPLELLTSLDDGASDDEAAELLARWKTTSWAETDRGVLYAMFVTMALMLEEELREALIYFHNRVSSRSGEGKLSQLTTLMFSEYLREINARSFFIKFFSWLSAAATGLAILGLERGDGQYTAEQQRRSKVVPLLLAPAIFLGVLYEMYELFATSRKLGELSVMFTNMFKKNVTSWLLFFAFFLMQFWFAILLVLPVNAIDEEAVQTPYSLLFNLLVLAFTGDNFDLDFGLSGDTTSRDWRVGDKGDHLIGVALPRVYLTFFYVVFMIVSVIILLNLLIAMMSSTYDDFMKIAAMETRHMKARRVLRMELLTRNLMKCLGKDQRVGSKPKDGSDRRLYEKMTVENNQEGQVVEGGSDIFQDPTDSAADGQPAWARRLAEELRETRAAAASAAASAAAAAGMASGRPVARPAAGYDGNDAAPPPYAAALASEALGSIDFSGSIDPFLAATTTRGGGGNNGPISLAPRLPPLGETRGRDLAAGTLGLTPQGRGGPHPNFGAARSHRPAPPGPHRASTTTTGGGAGE